MPSGVPALTPTSAPSLAWAWLRIRSYWTHTVMSCSIAPGSRSPTTTGMIIASHATARAASPSSQAPPSLGPTEAAARAAAHRARYAAIHRSCSTESLSISSRSGRPMCTSALVGCPARAGTRLAASSRFIASFSAS